jgi:hypothetical protein
MMAKLILPAFRSGMFCAEPGENSEVQATPLPSAERASSRQMALPAAW